MLKVLDGSKFWSELCGCRKSPPSHRSLVFLKRSVTHSYIRQTGSGTADLLNMSRTTRTTLCTARQVISVTQSASTSARAGSATSVPLSAPSRYARSSSRFLATTAGPQEAAGSSEASGESSRSSPSSPRKAASAASGGVGETSEEAFRRNIREVREWRRRKESQRELISACTAAMQSIPDESSDGTTDLIKQEPSFPFLSLHQPPPRSLHHHPPAYLSQRY